MERNGTSVFAKSLLFAFFLLNSLPGYAQNGTSDDGFVIQIILPNGEKQLHLPGYSGYGGAQFGGDITQDFETDLVWSRTDAGDTLACQPVINAVELAGKAALVRRGGCTFQQKANNVEAAGAAVMIVVNHALNASEDDYFTLEMSPAAGLPEVNIPCVFLNRASSVAIAAALDAGLPVKVKFLFPLLGQPVSAYHFATPVSQVQPLNHIGVAYTNRSADPVTDVAVKADIVEPDGKVVSMLALAPPAAPGETVFVPFPSYTPPPSLGRFDVFFSTNKYLQQYDTVKSSFVHTGNTFATDNLELTPAGAGPADWLFQISYQYQTAGLCNTGSQGGTATYATFGIANIADVYVPGDPNANTITVFLLDADLDNDGEIDPFFDFFELGLVAYNTYEMQGTEQANELINVPLVDINTGNFSVPLLPDHSYYLLLYYDGTASGQGKSVQFSASRLVDYLAFPTTPIFLDQLYNGGWSGSTVVQRLQLEGFSPFDPQPSAPPVAAFIHSGNDLSVVFNNNSKDAQSYSWDFGDGNTSTDANPVHAYATAGIYTVKLIATGAGGSHATIKVIDVGNNAAPVTADFKTNLNGGCVPVTVQYTDESSGPVVSHIWSLPGTSEGLSIVPNPVVIYQSPGTYDVSLLVSNGIVADAVSKPAQIVTLDVPNAGFDLPIVNGATASFTNTSLSADNYLWDFGDGTTSNEVNPVHTFPADGEYVVLLTASNNCGFSLYSLPVTVQLPVKAAFSADLQLGCAPLTVHFTNQSSASATGFNWSFPGGTPATSTDPNPTVVYSTPGVYAVELAVEAPAGTDTLAQPGYISVGAAPSAGFNFAVDSTTVVFNNTSQDASAFNWNFGDGFISNEADPVHTYAGGGTYTVTLTAENDCGQTIATQTVTISSGAGVPWLPAGQVRLTPNPADTEIRVELSLIAENAWVSVTLLDGTGRQVMSEQLNRFRQGVVTLPVRQLPAGAYQVWVRSEEGVAVRTVQVQH